MKSIISIIKNIFKPKNSNDVKWLYVAGEGRWIKKKPVNIFARIAMFAAGLVAVAVAGFYFLSPEQATAYLKTLTNPVTVNNERVIFEVKLNSENDIIENGNANANLNAPAIITTESRPDNTSENDNHNQILSTQRTFAAVNNVLPNKPKGDIIIEDLDLIFPPVNQRRPKSKVPQDLRDYWIKIEKGNYTLSLYKGDDVVKTYNVAVGKNPGDKQRKGDHRTPVGDFHVTSIEDSSKWKHDFGDGKGKIAGAYGPWFIRLDAGGWKGIGIHGTHDPDSLGTMASEGCIRMENSEIQELRNYAYRSMRVLIEE